MKTAKYKIGDIVWLHTLDQYGSQWFKGLIVQEAPSAFWAKRWVIQANTHHSGYGMSYTSTDRFTRAEWRIRKSKPPKNK